MSRDLEEQLQEMGEDYRDVVGRLRRAYEPLSLEVAGRAEPARPARRGSPARVVGWTVGYLAAASLLVCLGLGIVFRVAPRDGAGVVAHVTDVKTEYSLAYLRTDEAVRAMIRSQHADGGWANDFLTRQNVQALKMSDLPEARVAVKRALRNLRVRGML